MAEDNEKNKAKYSGDELENILKRLERQGLIDADEAYFQDLKEAILKRKKKEIVFLKKELEDLAKQRFDTRAAYLEYLTTLFPDVPLPPLGF